MHCSNLTQVLFILRLLDAYPRFFREPSVVKRSQRELKSSVKVKFVVNFTIYQVNSMCLLFPLTSGISITKCLCP